MGRTYKTSEMIAMLEKNPKSELWFQVSPYSEKKTLYDKVCLVNGILCWGGNPKLPFQISIGEYDLNWWLVREPVPVWEAIKALSEGKSVTCKIINRLGHWEKITFHPQYILQDHLVLTVKNLFRGTWYIEEPAND